MLFLIISLWTMYPQAPVSSNLSTQQDGVEVCIQVKNDGDVLIWVKTESTPFIVFITIDNNEVHGISWFVKDQTAIGMFENPILARQFLLSLYRGKVLKFGFPEKVVGFPTKGLEKYSWIFEKRY